LVVIVHLVSDCTHLTQCPKLLGRISIPKGDSLKQAHNAINADLNNTIAFGDGQNDYEILSYVKKGFIMKNASDKLKKLLPDT
ncbi:HAD hydrolase family protein, partial [Vibrio aestuarianus]